MNTVGTPLLWGGFAVVVAIMLAIDLLLQGRRGSHSMTMKQAAGWSILWVTLSLLFNAAFWWYLVQTQGRAVADPQANRRKYEVLSKFCCQNAAQSTGNS